MIKFTPVRRSYSNWIIILPFIVLLPTDPTSACVVVEDYGPADDIPVCIESEGDHDIVYTYCPRATNQECPGGDIRCETQLVPQIVEQEADPDGNFLDVLRAEYPPSEGWSYEIALYPLSCGTIHVKSYDSGSLPGLSASSLLYVRYEPGEDDPQDHIHWIQVVTDNHNETYDPGHGNPENVVDNEFSMAHTPYYDDGGCAEGGSCFPWCALIDWPSRLDAERTHEWSATTFLVQGPDIGTGPGKITVYTPGFRWGWVNLCTENEILDYIGDVNGTAELQSTGQLALGATIDLEVVTPASMLLSKAGVSADVQLESAHVSITIGDEIEHTSGNVSLEVNGGEGVFQPYLFGEISVGTSTFSIDGGSGWIRWHTGEVSVQVAVTVGAAGFLPIEAVAQGSGLIDFDTNTISLDPDARAVERPSPIPTRQTTWGRIKARYR